MIQNEREYSGARKTEVWWSGRESVDQVLILKELAHIYRETRKKRYVTSMDMEKIYDKLCRENLWRMMYEYGVEE